MEEGKSVINLNVPVMIKRSFRSLADDAGKSMTEYFIELIRERIANLKDEKE